MTSPALRLIDYFGSLSERDLAPPLAQNAATALLDSVGCGLYGSRQQWGEISSRFVRNEQSQGAATLYGCGTALAPARAALANGTSTHGFELDDMLPEALVHPGAVVVSAALATAQQVQASGPRLLLGLVAGYEMMGRLGLALGTEQNNLGFHTTGIAGPVAAALACGVVMRLDPPRMLSAIGIACSSAAGIKAFTQGTGGMIKRMHAGRAAEAGVAACELAQLGFTGPTDGIAGRFGLLQVIGGAGARPEQLDHSLGASFQISQVWVKVYSCCGVIHSTMHALETLKREHGYSATDVRSVCIHAGRRAVEQNGERDPHETMAAQYSIPFCAAVAIAKDARDPTAWEQHLLDDPMVRKIASRTTLAVDAEIDRLFPAHFGARAVVTLADGRVLEATVIDPHGSAADPCTPADVEAKFRKLAGHVTSAAAVENIVAAARDLPSAPTLNALSKALRAQGAAATPSTGIPK